MKGKILIIEDDPLNMKLTRDLILMNDMEAISAFNAEEGIEMANQSKPDLILMDIQLPGMSGIEATKILKENKDIASIPVVALSAHAMKEDRKKAVDAGCCGYITKPIDTRNFISKIRKYLTVKAIEEEKKISAEENHISESGGVRRILVVDDDPLNIKLFNSYFEGLDIEIINACNGKKALSTIDAFKGNIDLILMDIMMPEMDGLTATKLIKSNTDLKDIPVIVITSLNDAKEKEKAKYCGADEFITKPINRVELITRVNTLINIKTYKEQLSIRKATKNNIVEKRRIFEREQNENDNLTGGTILFLGLNKQTAIKISSSIQGVTSRYIIADDCGHAKKILSNNNIDLFFIFQQNIDVSFISLFKDIKEKEQSQNIPIMVLSVINDDSTRLLSIESGCDDYLQYPCSLKEISVRAKSLITKKKRVELIINKFESAVNAAITDNLTGLYNSSYFKYFIELEMKRCLRQKYSMGLIIMDVDNFKNFNDTWGHLTGDKVLKKVGAVISKELRDIDLPARYGGEEFAVILPYVTIQEATAVAERIRMSIEKTAVLNMSNDTEIKITVSCGVAVYPNDAFESQALLHIADAQLYKAKNLGKNQVCSTQKILKA